MVAGEPVIVEEIPEVGHDATGQLLFVRTLRAPDMPRKLRLGVMVPINDPRNLPVEFYVNARPFPRRPHEQREFMDMLVNAEPIEISTVVIPAKGEGVTP
jgi:hypothetical protein